LSRNVADILFTKALHDYNAAELMVGVDPEHIGDQVFGNHLQQAVEKAAKSLIVELCRKYERTHDLHALFKTLSSKMPVPDFCEKLEILTPYAVVERYETPLARHHVKRPHLLKLVADFLEWVGDERTRLYHGR